MQHLVLRQVRFVAAGTPVPQGSKRLGRNRRTGRAIILDDPRLLKDWRTRLAWCAKQARDMRGIRKPFTGAVEVEVIFYFTRGRTVKRDRPAVKPDLDKLVRALFDALTATLVKDDAQVVKLTASKAYVIHDDAITPGCVATVRELGEGKR